MCQATKYQCVILEKKKNVILVISYANEMLLCLRLKLAIAQYKLNGKIYANLNF